MKLMKPVKLYITAFAASAVIAGTSQAIIIDPFSQPGGPPGSNKVTVDETAPVATAVQAGANILGGDREIALFLTGSQIAGNTASVNVASSRLSFSTESTVSARAFVIYDGIDGVINPLPDPMTATSAYSPGALDITTTGGGLGSLRLDGESFFKLTILEAGAEGATFNMRVYGETGTESFVSFSVGAVTAGSPVERLISFGDFSGLTTNFDKASAVVLEIIGNANVDLTLASVASATPEPSSALAALGVLAVLGQVGLRRNRSALVANS